MPSTNEHNGAWVAGSMDEDVDVEEVKQDEVLLGDKIVGVEGVTLDQRGPGAGATENPTDAYSSTS